MTKFEYLTASMMVGGNGQIKALKAGAYGNEWHAIDLTNTYGADGWEMIGFLPGAAPNQVICFFKRVAEAS